MKIFLLMVNLVSASLGIYCFPKLKFSPIKPLIIFFIIYFFIDSIVLEYVVSYKIVNVTYSILYPIEYFIYFFVFNYNVKKTSFQYYSQFLGGLLLILLAIYQILFNWNSETMSTNVFLFHCILTLIVVLNYFKNILIRKSIIILSEQPLFWAATGLLFFMSGNVISTGFYHQLYHFSKNLARAMYNLNYILNILLCIFFDFGFIISIKIGIDNAE